MLMRWSSTFCNSSGSERFSTTKTVQGESIFRERRLEGFADLFGKSALVRGHIQEWYLLAAKASVILAIMVLRKLAFEIGKHDKCRECR